MWETAMKWLHIAVLFVLLNILWVIGSAFGLVIFGLIPSTISILKLLTLPGIFNNEYGYGEMIIRYFREFLIAFKHSKVLLFMPVLIEIIILMELYFIKNISILQAIFQIPLNVLLIYVFFIIFHISYLSSQMELLTLKEGKMLLLSPLIFSKSSLLILIVIISLSIITMIKSWVVMIVFSVFIYASYRLVKQDYESKGWSI